MRRRKKVSTNQTSMCRVKLHARSTMFGAWTLSRSVCPIADESNASRLLMTSVINALILQWTLESLVNMSLDL